MSRRDDVAHSDYNDYATEDRGNVLIKFDDIRVG